jgi:hypothetical protein
MYLGLGALLALVIGVIWCFMAGPCAGSTSASGTASGAGVGGSIANAATGGISSVIDAASNAMDAVSQSGIGSELGIPQLGIN